jgi:hypothetical protein
MKYQSQLDLLCRLCKKQGLELWWRDGVFVARDTATLVLRGKCKTPGGLLFYLARGSRPSLRGT